MRSLRSAGVCGAFAVLAALPTRASVDLSWPEVPGTNGSWGGYNNPVSHPSLNPVSHPSLPMPVVAASSTTSACKAVWTLVLVAAGGGVCFFGTAEKVAVPRELRGTRGRGGVVTDGWSLYQRQHGPQTMRVAVIRIENHSGQAFQLPHDPALIGALRLFAERKDFIGFSIGPDCVEIYESCSREALVSKFTRSLDWHTHIRQPGSQGGLVRAGGRASSGSWASTEVYTGSAVHNSEVVPVATLTFEEGTGFEGYLGFKENGFHAAMRMLCEEKLFTAASVGMEEVGWSDPVEVNPPENRRKYSSSQTGYANGMLDGNGSWRPQVGDGDSTLLDLGESQHVQGLVIQGHPGHGLGNYVREVKVDCGLLENELFAVRDVSNNVARMFVTGTNYEVNARAFVDFPQGPVLARFVKISVMAQANMRVGVRVASKRQDGGVKVHFYKVASRRELLPHRVQDERSTLYLR